MFFSLVKGDTLFFVLDSKSTQAKGRSERVRSDDVTRKRTHTSDISSNVFILSFVCRKVKFGFLLQLILSSQCFTCPVFRNLNHVISPLFSWSLFSIKISENRYFKFYGYTIFLQTLKEKCTTKKTFTTQELNMFFGRIHFHFPPINNISLFLKTAKMYIFPTYSPKWNLQSHILRGYLKNSVNKICNVV